MSPMCVCDANLYPNTTYVNVKGAVRIVLCDFMFAGSGNVSTQNYTLPSERHEGKIGQILWPFYT